MSSHRTASGTERLSRALIRLLPRATREDIGEPMVQLATDRRRHRGEPIWRLWPSLAADTVSTAARSHWEESMPRLPAVVIGLIFAIAAFAVLSASPVIGLGIAAIGGLVLWTQRGSVPAAGSEQRPWLRWAVIGAVLVVVSFGIIAVQDDEFGAPAWMAIMGTLLAGLTGLGTAAVLAFEGRSRSNPVS